MKEYKHRLIAEITKTGLSLDLAVDIANVLLPELLYENQQEQEDREFTRLTLVKKAIQGTLINA